jgi:CRISPR-associated protein Csx10
MKHFDLTVRCPAGTLLVGGYSAVPQGLDAVHATGSDGKPLIPSTALRGALRETAEALVRGAGMRACAGGSGRDPRDEAKTPTPCTIADGKPCAPCRLFGTQTEKLRGGAATFSALVLGPALLADAATVDWQTRHSVSVGRKRRSAAHGRLFDRHMPNLSKAHAFVATGRITDDDPELETILRASVVATKHVGSGRSRGLGRIDIEMNEVEHSDGAERALPDDGAVRIVATLATPANIGVALNAENFRATRDHVPGTALRGAVGFALAEVLDAPNEDDAFQSLVAEDGAHFGFLYPTTNDRAPGPWPLTARSCKAHGPAHGVVDLLEHRIALSLATNADAAGRLDALAKRECRQCRGPLRRPGGTRGAANVPTRSVTRVALDRRRSSAKQGALFSNEMIQEGATFEGTVRNIPPASREHLARALRQPISFGRGRGAGWGRVELEVLPQRQRDTLSARAKEFDRRLRVLLERAKMPTDRVGHLVAVRLLSPLVPSDPSGDVDGRADLLRMFQPIGATVHLAVRRFGVEGAWDQRTGRATAVRSVVGGSCFVLDLGDATWTDALEVLEHLENHGAGARRHQGFGELVLFEHIAATLE